MIKVGDKFFFNTGRLYDTEQVLACEVVDIIKAAYIVRIADASRDMVVFVKVERFLKESLLEMYDSGQYVLTWLIARPVNGISLNRLEYLEDNNGHSRVFTSVEKAHQFLLDAGISQNEIDNGDIIIAENL